MHLLDCVPTSGVWVMQLLQNRQTYGVIREEFKTLMEIVKMDIPFTVKTIGAFHDLHCVHFVMVGAYIALQAHIVYSVIMRLRTFLTNALLALNRNTWPVGKCFHS